jgi:hypothetical protein
VFPLEHEILSWLSIGINCLVEKPAKFMHAHAISFLASNAIDHYLQHCETFTAGDTTIKR